MSQPFGDSSDPRFTPDGKADPNFRDFTLTADLLVGVTTFSDVYGRDKQYTPIFLWQLAEMATEPRQATVKEELPLFSGWLYGNIASLHSGSYRTLVNLISCALLVADYDGEDVTWLEMVRAKLKALGVKALIIPTPSYTEAAPRFRLVIPLCETIYTADEYRRLIARLDALLNCTLAVESYNAAQGFFLGVLQGRVPVSATWINGPNFFDLVSDHLADREDDLIKLKHKRKSVATGTPAEVEADKDVTVSPEIQLEYMTRRGKKKLADAPPDRKYFTLRDVAFWIGGVSRKFTGYTLEAIAELLVDWLREASTEMNDEDHARDVALRCLRDGAAEPLLIIPELESVNLGEPFRGAKVHTEGFAQWGREPEFFDPFDPGEPLRSFPGGILRPDFEATIQALALHNGVPFGALVMAMLAGVSAVADKRTRFFPYVAIRVARQPAGVFYRFDPDDGTNWWQPPILWILVISLSGNRKSRIKNIGFRVPQQIRSHIKQLYRAALRSWNRLTKAQQKEEPKPEEPPPLLLDVASAEGVDQLLALTDRGLAIAFDEGSAWLSFARYSSGKGAEAAAAERGTWCGYFEAISTQTGKVGRKSDTECNGVSIFALIPQSVLAKFRHSDDEDGLFQRILPVEAPDVPPADLSVPIIGLDVLEAAIRRLWVQGPTHYTTTLEGGEIIERMENYAAELRAKTRTSGGFKAACGKFHGQLARLALVLHMMEDPCIPHINPTIPTDVVARADRLMRQYPIPQLLRFFDGANSVTEESLELASFVLKHAAEIGDVIVQRSVMRGVKGHRKTETPGLNDLMDEARRWGWVWPETPFRQSNTKWFITPGLLKHFDAKAKQDRIARAESDRLLSDLKMAGSRKPDLTKSVQFGQGLEPL